MPRSRSGPVGIHDADCETRYLLIHFRISGFAAGSSCKQKPVRIIGCWRGRLFSPVEAGWRFLRLQGRRCSATGASADIRRSGVKVAITSTPKLCFDFQIGRAAAPLDLAFPARNLRAALHRLSLATNG